MRRLLVCLLGFAVFAAFADQTVYKVTDNVAGVDLLADSETYFTDRMEGPVPGTNYTVNGEITHSAVSSDEPFQFLADANGDANNYGMLYLTDTGLNSSTPLSFSGYGCFLFNTYTVETPYLEWSSNTNFQVDDKAGVRFSRFYVVADGGSSTKLVFRPLPNETRVRGVASGCGQHGIEFVLGGEGKSGPVTLVFDNAGRFFSDYPAFGCYNAPSTIVISNTVFESYYPKFGVNSSNDGSGTSVTNVVSIGPGGVFSPNLFSVYRDPRLKIVFDGGVFQSRHGGAYSMGLDGASAVLLRTTPGNDFNIDIPGSYVDLYQKGQNFDLSGPGNLVKTGAGALKFSAPVAYEGETYVNEGTIEIFDDNALPVTPLHLASGAKMALYSSRQEVPSIDGLGLVTSPDGNGTLAIGDGNDFTLMNVANTVSIAKRGSGTMTMFGTYGKHLGVEEGKAIVKESDAAKPHRYWRFKVDTIRGSVDMMQFSELKLFSNGVDVTSSAESVSWDTDPDRKSTQGKNYPDGENPTKAYDGNVNSKWLDRRAGVNEPAEVRDSVWLMFDYGSSPIVINGYEWYTANDEPPRDPVSWRLQYSDDASTWTILDAQSNYPVPENRKVLAYSYNNIIGKGGTLEWVRVAADASLELDGCDLSAKSFDFPTNATVNIVNGGALELAAAAGEDADSTFGAIVSDETANAFDLRKTGAGTNTVLTARSLAARLDVQAGVLKITAVPESKFLFFRWTVKRVRGNNEIMQLSEFSLYDKDGNRLNANLAKVDPGTAEPYEMAPGSVTTPVTYSVGAVRENFDKVVDGNTATKWCLTNNTMNDPDNESTWRTLVMRLPADAANVVSYSFTTANDFTPARNPSTWVLEASADGRTWQVVDERTDVGATPTSIFTESARFEVARSTAAVPTEDAFAAGSVVSVASGARLVLDDNGTSSIKNMVVDATIGGGTIEGFKAAQTGTIDIVNIPGTLSELYESTIFTVVNPAEYTSLAGWTVKIDGVSVDSRLKITPEGDVKFAERGFMVIFR